MKKCLHTQVFEMTSEPENLKTIREDIRPLLERAGFSKKSLENILVVIGEACTNALRHAYDNKPNCKIVINYEEDQEKVTLKIRDWGKKIDLTKIKKPQLPPQKGGGLGIYFMQTMMDEMRYNNDHPEGNELILSKLKEKGDSSENPN